MYLQSIAHATPHAAFTQPECWQILKNSDALEKLSSRSISLLEKILLGDSGITRRYFATDSVEGLFSLDAEALNKSFEAKAPKVAGDALIKALHKAGLGPEDLDALLICTCTGYLCPGLTSYVSEQLGLRPNVYLQDIVGLGCGAAIPTLRSAAGVLAASPEATVACIAVEICSSAFYLANEPGVLISACLFGDAASASIWTNSGNHTGYKLNGFDTIHVPENRELIRFVNAGGKLRNQLHRSVPEKAAKAVSKLFANAQTTADVAVANHTGGRDVIDALESALPGHSLKPSRATLQDYGNTSSPSILLSLEAMLAEADPSPDIWMTSFGAGFAAHSCRISRK